MAQVLYDALKQMPAVSVPVTGSGNFSGFMRITNFVGTPNGGINAVVNVVNSAGTAVAENVSVPVDLAATAANNTPPPAATQAGAQATCDILNLVLGPLDLNLLGLRVQLNQVILNITAVTGANALLGNLLCTVTGLLNPLGTLAQLLDVFNQIATLLNTLGNLANLPVAAPATVSGTMLLDNFSQQGQQILANGTLAQQPVSIPLIGGAAPAGAASAQATCNVLNLNLGPLDLNLLGLQVNLNQVILDITAVTGTNNLVGNLLCAITGLLSPISQLSQLLDLLNNIIRSF